MPFGANEVIFESEASTDGEVFSKLNFTFAIAKTSQAEKERTLRIKPFVLSFCFDKGSSNRNLRFGVLFDKGSSNRNLRFGVLFDKWLPKAKNELCGSLRNELL